MTVHLINAPVKNLSLGQILFGVSIFRLLQSFLAGRGERICLVTVLFLFSIDCTFGALFL